MKLERSKIRKLVQLALAEDIGLGDVTTHATVDADAEAEAAILAKQPLVVCGLGVAEIVFAEVDPRVQWLPDDRYGVDGTLVPEGQCVARVRGPAQSILTGERVALNLLQRMSGVATLTRQFVHALAGTGVSVSDTRKTMPGLRMLDKYAVSAGGGANHRWALDSGVLIKDNHLLAAGSVARAVAAAQAQAPHLLKVQVECKAPHQVREALHAGADAVLLDNMRGDVLARAVEIAKGRAFIEVSGGVTLSTVRELALTGVDLISTGQLTHSATAVDLALDIEKVSATIRGWRVERRESCVSTNDAVKELAAAGERAGMAVVAGRQTAGRGRHGRQWYSPHGGHLAVSALFRPALSVDKAPRVSLAGGLAVAVALSRWLSAEELELKWPNDVLYRGKKVAGVLAEMSTSDGGVSHVVVGVGINVNVNSDEWPRELVARATSMEEAAGAPVDQELVLGEVLSELERQVTALEVRGGELDLAVFQPWLRVGRAVVVDSGSPSAWRGVVQGLRADGALLLAGPDGEPRVLMAADVIPQEWEV